MNKNKLSFVIPCYNSENTIRGVVHEIADVMKSHAEYEHEIILVSDASPDNVYDVITDIADEYENITGVELAKNFGQHAALMAGYRLCAGDIIISLDDDGQTPANEVFSLINMVVAGHDVVFARYYAVKQNVFRVCGSNINDYMLKVLIGKPKDIKATSYFACKRYVIDEMLRYDNAYTYITGLVFRTTKDIVNVDVNHRERVSGKSSYSLNKLLSLWMNGATAFSVKPLRLSTIFGMVCALVGFVLTVYVVVNKLLNPEISAGYSSTMAVMLFLGGIIMIMLGVLGEYIGRMYIIQNNSPQYVVRRKTETKKEESDGVSI